MNIEKQIGGFILFPFNLGIFPQHILVLAKSTVCSSINVIALHCSA